MQNYKDLKVWEKSHQFTLLVYEVSKAFPKEEMYSLTNQLRRAASSVSANIAEGYGKNSQAEFAQYLNIALGSANESEYFLILTRDLNYLKPEDYEKLFILINEIKTMLISLIQKVKNKT